MPADRAKPTILIVHDDVTVHRFLGEVCTLEDYAVETAEYGDEVIEILARQPRPSRIMVIQPLLRDMEAMTLIRYVRSEPAIAALTKVVAMTVPYRLMEIPDDAVDGKLAMPISSDSLIAIIEQLS